MTVVLFFLCNFILDPARGHDIFAQSGELYTAPFVPFFVRATVVLVRCRLSRISNWQMHALPKK